ncbi:MAG: transcriptional regulator [Lachnospiraceae bacterium]|nr:transcriptional regulator [Lachnospiraceae bacterium]
MAVKTEFTEFVANDIKKYDGVRMPLKASFLTRTFRKWTRCTNIHPNPDDEFCFPEIGPNFGIISDYENKMRHGMRYGSGPWSEIDERLMVEKMYPHGFMLINGHHRWAAAVRMKLKKAPIQILNLVHEEDIINMVERSKNNRRVAVDLNDMVFVNGTGLPAEKELSFPSNIRFKERIRLGFPALCRFLQSMKYDVWVFTADYCSVDYIEDLLKKYHVRPDGIITASERLQRTSEEKKNQIKDVMRKKYIRTLTLYNDMVLVVDNESGDYRQIGLEGTAEDWSASVIKAVKGIEGSEEK